MQSPQGYTHGGSMLVNKSKAAELAGVSRRTFYNHIPKKRISTVVDDDGVEKIHISELERVYGKEKVLKNRKNLEDANDNNANSVQAAQPNTPKSVQVEKVVLEEKLKSAETLIEQLKAEQGRLVEDKQRIQAQLDKALEIGAPIGKLLTDQRTSNKGRALAERKAIEEGIKKEAAEKKLKLMARRLRETSEELEAIKKQGFFKKLFG